jgi:hypothetical protein
VTRKQRREQRIRNANRDAAQAQLFQTVERHFGRRHDVVLKQLLAALAAGHQQFGERFFVSGRRRRAAFVQKRREHIEVGRQFLRELLEFLGHGRCFDRVRDGDREQQQQHDAPQHSVVHETAFRISSRDRRWIDPQKVRRI